MNQADYYDKFTNKVFVKYFSTHNPRLAAAKKLCNKFVNTGDRVLEIGCGVGIIAKHLKHRVNYYAGTDLSVEALEIARKLYDSNCNTPMKFINKKVSELNFLESKFEAIILIDVVKHLENFYTDLQTLSTMLSDNGRLIIQCPTPEATAKNMTPQFVEKPIRIEGIMLATGFRLAYLNYFGVEHENQYMQLVLTEQLATEPIKPNKLLSGVKSRWLRLKNRRLLETLGSF